ncbi:hypothetical protein EKO27_g10309 [Xylaria grammica]|uniref:Uncharacterized protein n=1 Tax=Xylaria grammica TaxID=363999 RepID=A0A439CRJ8_9PEZI|nr:hypothetical protein EKO27_g10309 [Xylaria grammica]
MGKASRLPRPSLLAMSPGFVGHFKSSTAFADEIRFESDMTQNTDPAYRAPAFAAYWTPNGDPFPEIADPNAPLREILLKVLSITGDSSFLDGGEAGGYHLQRDISLRYKSWFPMPGNDFHAGGSPPAADPSAWSARLLVHRPRTALVPWTHRSQRGGYQGGDHEAASLVDEQWPDDPPEHKIMRWLASLGLGAIIVGLSVFRKTNGGWQSRLVFPPESPRHEIPFMELSQEEIERYPRLYLHYGNRTTNRDVLGVPGDVGHFWSFTSQGEPMVLSIPLIAAVLVLMSNPRKPLTGKGEVTPDDRDLSWCLDSLQGFCRPEPPSRGKRDLSWSLGTYEDCWIYLSFITTCYRFREGKDDDDDDAQGKLGSSPDGLLCERDRFTLPGIGTFTEERMLLIARAATGCDAPVGPLPAAVGIFISDMEYKPDYQSAASTGDGPPDECGGLVVLREMMLYQLNQWRTNWLHTLNQVEIYMRTVASLGGNRAEKRRDLAAAKQLLRKLGGKMDAERMALSRMHREWEKVYPESHAGRFLG